MQRNLSLEMWASGPLERPVSKRHDADCKRRGVEVEGNEGKRYGSGSEWRDDMSPLTGRNLGRNYHPQQGLRAALDYSIGIIHCETKISFDESYPLHSYDRDDFAGIAFKYTPVQSR